MEIWYQTRHVWALSNELEEGMPTRFPLLALTVCLSLAPLGVCLSGQPGTTPVNPDGPASPILFRGTETFVVSIPPAKGKPRFAAGWDMPEGFVLRSFDLSRDGRRVWLALSNSDVNFKGHRWQVWSMNSDGSDPKQAAFAVDKLPGAPALLTNRDGSVAWLFANPGGGAYQVFHFATGGAGRLVADSKDLKDFGSGGYPRVTADGKSLFFLAHNLGLVQLRDDGTTKLVLAKKEVTHQKMTLANEWMAHLAINADGSQYAFVSRFNGLKDRPSVIVRQTAQGQRLHPDPTPTAAFSVFDGVEMSEDGATVLLERSSSAKGGRLLLWRGDVVRPLKADVPDTAYGFVAGDGKVLYGATGDFGFLEDAATGKRHRAMTKAVYGWHTSYTRNHRLSSDGSVVAMLYPGGDVHPHGLYLFQAGEAPTGYPVLKSVRQRYDGGKLLVTVETDPKAPPARVLAQALRDGYINPHQVLKPDDNPLKDPLWFPDATLSPVEGRPGVYQLVIDVGTKRGLLNDSFSLRLVAVNAERNRSTFVDVPVLRDDGLPPIAYSNFDAFRKELAQAKYEDYKGKPGVRVAGEAEFNKMKAYLVDYYKNLPVTHTFVEHGGGHVDCVAIDKQPGAVAEVKRGHKLQLAPPALPGVPKFATDKKMPTDMQGHAAHTRQGHKDRFGNEMHCPAGSVPIRRMALADLTRHAKLTDFLQKHHSSYPRAKAGAKCGPEEMAEVLGDPTAGHRYAAVMQKVDNVGGSSWLSLWRPVPTPYQFSLSQQWYAGGDPLQTVEGGWVVNPATYGHSLPVLFIYWTADNYQTTGAWNLTGPGFIQVSNAFVIGGTWSTWSTPSGPQWGFQMAWHRDPTTGNWWLFLKGAGNLVPVGYYPRSLFGNGQMSKYATQITFGGEVTGAPATGQMGSGGYAKDNWLGAAFQKEIYYFPTTGGSQWGFFTDPPILTNPDFYTLDLFINFGNWGTYIFFGGPGGK
jgi:hypothetical protein